MSVLLWHRFINHEVILNCVILNCSGVEFGQKVARDSLEISLQRSRAFESASAQRSGFMGCHLKLEK